MRIEDITRICPLCNQKLYDRYEGLVCKNWKCKLFHKRGEGWIFNSNKKKENVNNFLLKFYADINGYSNIKKWLELKRFILKRDKYTCKKCGKNLQDDCIPILEVHHIIPRHEAPELTYDKDNCITLCEECHTFVHSKDKRRFK